MCCQQLVTSTVDMNIMMCQLTTCSLLGAQLWVSALLCCERDVSLALH